MITVDQIPADVKKAMRAAWARRNNSDAPEKHMADLAVAALSAWPEARLIRNALSNSPKYIKLPVEGLTQETRDDQ